MRLDVYRRPAVVHDNMVYITKRVICNCNNYDVAIAVMSNK